MLNKEIHLADFLKIKWREMDLFVQMLTHAVDKNI